MLYCPHCGQQQFTTTCMNCLNNLVNPKPIELSQALDDAGVRVAVENLKDAKKQCINTINNGWKITNPESLVKNIIVALAALNGEAND